MDLNLTSEQKQMKSTLREFLESKGGIELARRQINDDEEVIDELWNDLASMDYMALTVPIEHTGLGEDLFYLSILLEEAGRYAMPGPLPETLGFCVPLLAELGTEEQQQAYLPAIADGEEQWSFAVYENGTEKVPEDIQLEAESTDDGYRLDGTKTLVPYGGDVDYLIVPVRTAGETEDGITLFVVDSKDVETQELDSLDETRPMYEIRFDNIRLTEEDRLGTSHNSENHLREAMDRYIVATGAMLIGAAERAVELSVEHGNTREQFGQPIGRFQAVKHRIADMWIDKRAGRSLVYYAAWAVANESAEGSRAVSAVKSFCTESCIRIFGDDIQNHGGTGFTWDHDGHIYLKQAKAWESHFGAPRDHRDRLAKIHEF